VNNEIIEVEDQLVFEGKPWERQPGESTKHFDRFVIFLRLGTSRTMSACYRQWRRATGDASQWKTGYKPSRPPETWMEVCREWNWYARAAEWDMHLFDEETDIWMMRRESLREEEFSLSEELIQRAKELLDWPIAHETHPALNKLGNPILDDDGRPIYQKIEPSKWTLSDAVRMITAGDELRRRATGGAASVSLVIDIPWDKLNRDQLKRIYDGEDYEQILLESQTADSGDS